MHSNEITPHPKKKRIYRWVGIFLLVISSPSIIERTYLSYLRNKTPNCYQEQSPDSDYSLEKCYLKSERERGISFLYNTDIKEVSVIDSATNKLIHKATLIGPYWKFEPVEWKTCNEVPADKRPTVWRPGAVCHVRWATAYGSGLPAESDYQIYLPPSKWQQFKAKLPW